MTELSVVLAQITVLTVQVVCVRPVKTTGLLMQREFVLTPALAAPTQIMPFTSVLLVNQHAQLVLAQPYKTAQHVSKAGILGLVATSAIPNVLHVLVPQPGIVNPVLRCTISSKKKNVPSNVIRTPTCKEDTLLGKYSDGMDTARPAQLVVPLVKTLIFAIAVTKDSNSTKCH